GAPRGPGGGLVVTRLSGPGDRHLVERVESEGTFDQVPVRVGGPALVDPGRACDTKAPRAHEAVGTGVAEGGVEIAQAALVAGSLDLRPRVVPEDVGQQSEVPLGDPGLEPLQVLGRAPGHQHLAGEDADALAPLV